MASILDSLYGALHQFSDDEKLAAWGKARVVPGYDAAAIRKDSCGAWIKWADYGNTDSQWGWEIDHIYPVSRGGTNHPDNLQALHWQNNRAKGDSTSGFTPAVAAAR